MTMHHVLTDRDTKDRCLYCGRRIERSRWKSEFEFELHYKTMVCGCGRKNRITVRFHGSGHDDWSGLEKKANKVTEKK